MAIFVKDKEFYKKIWFFGAPIAAQQMITVGVNMMDTIMLGQLNETVLAASSLATQVHNLFHFMCMGMGMGASVMIARYWGAGEPRSLSKTLTLMYRCCLLVAILFTLVVGITPAGVMRLLTTEEAVIAEGVKYLRWTLPCFLIYGLSQTTTLVLRNSRQNHVPLYTSIGAFFVNIFFNWVFIFGKLGAPAMGISGAALGTLISRCFEFSMICGFFIFKDKKIRFQIKDMLQPCGDLLPEYLRISMPVMVSDTLLGLGNSMCIAVAGRIGTTYMSANTITNVTQQIAVIFASALGQAAMIIIGNTLGEGDADKAQNQAVTFTALSVLIGLFCAGLIKTISPLVVGFYNIEAETKMVALELMNSVAVTMIFMTISSILTKGILRSGGDTRFLMVADILFLWVVSVPLGALAGLIWNWPPFWIFFCLKIDHLLKAVWCLFRLRSRKWIKKIRAV